MNKVILYLIPAPLSNDNINKWINLYNLDIIKKLNIFIVEELKTAYRILKNYGYDNLDKAEFYILNEHSNIYDIEKCFKPLLENNNVGLISEVGMPCVADPGNIIVAMAHKHEIKVTPLPGSSSLFMALAASGLNGQNFTFHGYIPIEKNARKKFLCQIELTAIKTKQSQIFIETPYRNQSLLDTILSICKPSTLLCIAINIGSMSEFIKTKSINEWKKLNIRISKEPAVFILGT